MIYSAEEFEMLQRIWNMVPICTAGIEGSPAYPKLNGRLWLYPMWEGTLVVARFSGLPADNGICGKKFFGFHIHSGASCTGNDQDAFADTDGHYNPHRCSHPEHAGDFPPILGNNGYAFMMFYTDRFQPEETEGLTVVVHTMPDDFNTQPAGNSGEKIGCGEIKRTEL